MFITTLLLSASMAQCTADAQHNIVETAVANPDFSTLVAAVQAAELQGTLAGPGPFTVFAPTNAAFAKLPKGTVEALLKPENKAMLQGILTNHVVAGKIAASTVVSTPGTVAVGGQWLAFTTDEKGAKVDGAWVKTTDIQCKNGVIHVIDTVMLPTDSDLVQVASKNGSFNTLVAAAQAAGLAETLKSPGPFTIFAPTDDAFSNLGDKTIASLLLPKNREVLARILKNHVVAGRLYSPEAISAGHVMTLAGTRLPIAITDQGAMVGTASIMATDVDAKNGVIHVIDTVLIPSTTVSMAKD
jgi:transforming growth factor-beta-induced protein